MQDVNLRDILNAMTAAALNSLGTSAKEVSDSTQTEFEKIGQIVQTIVDKLATGELKQDGAKILFDMQKNSASGALLELKGLSELAVQKAINAALDVAKDGFNKLVGFGLIG